jgi:hypothetical protein
MNATTLLLRRHRTLEQLVDALAYERHLRRPFIEELADELSAHLSTYETVLAPILGVLPPGVIARLNLVHARTRAALRVLQGATARDSAVDEETVNRLCAAAREYVAIERQLVIPAFEATMDASSLERLGHALYSMQLARPAATL